ncbi:TPA: transposase zinc-binding domain-containing protein [Klebsiella oxytoca]
MVTTSACGPVSPLSACLPVVPTCALGVRRLCCASQDCTHPRFFCQSCKTKACSACSMKSTEQWIAAQQLRSEYARQAAGSVPHPG